MIFLRHPPSVTSSHRSFDCTGIKKDKSNSHKSRGIKSLAHYPLCGQLRVVSHHKPGAVRFVTLLGVRSGFFCSDYGEVFIRPSYD